MMKNKLPYNEGKNINALIDEELDEVSKEMLLVQLDNDAELKADLCDSYRIKDLVQFAYPKSNEKVSSLSTNEHKIAWVASVLLALIMGVLAGYFGLQTSNSLHEPEAQTVTQNENNNKIILYLGSSKKQKFVETLDKAESLLTKYKEKGNMKVFVVTSAGGIDLLRINNSPIQQRIKTLKSLYSSLHFVACNTQIYQLHKKGKSVNLVDETEVAPSAVQFVVDHLKKGWGYIAI